MNLINLDNLVKAGKLKKEAFDQSEFDELMRGAEARLHDANNTTLALESRFDLAYNAAYAFALAALRKKGYRSNQRYLAFQALPATLGVAQEIWRVLERCQHHRNLAEYEGDYDIDEQLYYDLLESSQLLFDLIKKKY